MKTPRRDFWRLHVEGWKKSGLTARQYAEKHGLNRQGLNQWKHNFKRDGLRGVLEVRVASQPMIKVKFPSGETVLIGSGSETLLVKTVLRVLRAR